MRIATMTLQGFKSFGNRAVLEFAPGVTAIVGPNGSGKSNVIDALKWTTGGGRASAFRAEDKTDLIFHGATGKRGLSLAEVEIELHGKHQRLKLYRSIDREGTTRLRINGRNARFLDMEEALAGSGLGRSGLAVIGQGEVGEVLMADPERLLEYVAESAGAARLSSRRDQTQARLDTAKSHLERLADLLRELEMRAEDLAAEARDAEEHARLSAESLALSFTAASLRKEGYEGEIASFLVKEAALEEALAEGRAAFGEHRRAIEEARALRHHAEEHLRAAVAQLELRRGDLRVAAETRRRHQEGLEALERQRRALEEETAALSRLTAPVAPGSDEQTAETRVAAAVTAYEAANSALEAAQVEEQRLGARLRLARERHLAHERALAAYASRQQSLEEQRLAYQGRLEQFTAGEPVDLEALSAAAAAAASARESAETELDAARAALADEQRKHALAAAESTARARALERAKAAFESRRGYSQGPKNALSAPIDGVIGSVADLLRPEPGLQTAVAAALGRRAEYVVVSDSDVAKRVLEHVRAHGGYVTLLPLDLLRVPNYPTVQTGRSGVVRAAVDAVGVDPQYRRVVEMLLGGTLIVESLDAATNLARQSGPRSRLVTLEGDLIETSGAISGGRRNQQVSVLGAASELEEAEEAARSSAAEAAVLAERLATAQARVAAADGALQRALAEFTEHDRRLVAAGNEASSRERLRQELAERVAALTAELDTLTAPELPVDAAGGEADELAHVEALARLETARSERNAALAALTEARHAAQLLAQSWDSYRAELERFEAAKARLEQLTADASTLAEQRKAFEAEAAAAQAAYAVAEAAVPAGVQSEEAAAEAASARVTELERSLAQLNESHAERAAQVEEVRIALARREASLELAVEELSAFPDGVERLQMSERAARQRLRDVAEALEQLGAVNHRAKADLAEVVARKESIEVETVQAALAVTELESSLERVDKETTARLTAELERLQLAFSRQVQHLFGDGGHGAIEVSSDAGRPIGVRIVLTPPGKQTQSLQLLSVGERTMGALAFLFALMASPDGGGGLPVAVLDEVDAPLDEANIRRFCTFVSRLAKHGTQFVLITHQKATFEVADTLWGITTEQGVSRVFSMRREETVGV